jgi:hypothetical protein
MTPLPVPITADESPVIADDHRLTADGYDAPRPIVESGAGVSTPSMAPGMV